MTLRAERRWTLAISIGVALVLCALASPRSSRAEEVTFAPPWEGQLRYAGEFAGVRIAAGAGYQGTLTISREQTPSPDIVFVSPGGVLPPPLPCISPSADTIRCPVLNVTYLGLLMGAGDDRVDATRFDLPTQAGFRPEFRMGDGDDRFVGGSLGERWFGEPGNDFAQAGAGNDRLIAGSGNDRMFGDLGIDFFLGQQGRDFARGGKGNDRGNGGPGNDNFRD